MTTRAWSYPIANSNDATFRGWVTDFSTKLGEVGLQRTSDTGQINLTTVTRPTAGNTSAGYEIWRFPGTAIFIKFEYGTSSSTSSPQMWITVGTNSDGAGNLTGVVSARRTCNGSSFNGNGTTLNTSYMCFSEASGFFGFSAYLGAGAVSVPAVFTSFICRTVSVLGAPDGQGITVYWRGTDTSPSSAAVQALNTVTNTAQPIDTAGFYCVVPHAIVNTVVSGDQQAFLHWTAMPRVYPVMQIVTVASSEFLPTTTFTATVVGNTPKNYITLDSNIHGTYTGTTTSTPAFRCAMLWE